MPRKLTALATAALIGLGLNCGVAPASAFGEAGHRLITVAGLSPGGTETWSPTFLNGPVIEDINNEHEWMDKDFPWSTNGGQDELHFDDCEFDESISRINGPWPGLFGLSGGYAGAVNALKATTFSVSETTLDGYFTQRKTCIPTPTG